MGRHTMTREVVSVFVRFRAPLHMIHASNPPLQPDKAPKGFFDSFMALLKKEIKANKFNITGRYQDTFILA
jgi:hypothetical protein